MQTRACTRTEQGQGQDLDSQLEKIIAQASGPDEGLTDSQLTEQDFAELMLELGKQGGTKVALAVCEIIDGADKGYATRSPQVFNSVLCQCDPSQDPGVVEELLDRWASRLSRCSHLEELLCCSKHVGLGIRQHGIIGYPLDSPYQCLSIVPQSR